MKKQCSIVLFLSTLLVSAYSYTQEIAIEYTYDAAGNRIQRKVITLSDNEIEHEDDDAMSARGENTTSRTASITDQAFQYTYELFPNPVASSLTIRTSQQLSALDKITVSVFNMEGKLLQTNNVVGNSMVTVEMSTLSRGEYIVKWESVGEKREWKVVKL